MDSSDKIKKDSLMIIKRLILPFIVAIASSATALAQNTPEPRNTEVSVSYGALPVMSQIPYYHNHWDGLGQTWGTVNFTIDHRFADALWIGMSYTYSGDSSDRIDAAGHSGDIVWHGLMVNVRYEWMRNGDFTLYSHAGVGVLIAYYSPDNRDSWNRTGCAFQLNPIGAQWDFSHHAGLFAEAGYGVQGIIKAGIRVGF